MENKNNIFSFKRMGLLLREQWMFDHKTLLWTLLATYGGIVFMITLSALARPEELQVVSLMANGFNFMVLIILALMAIWRIHGMVHSNNALAYSAFPVTTAERFVQIILTGITYYIIAFIAIQLGLFTEILLSPGLDQVVLHQDNEMFFQGTLIFDPFIFFEYPVAGAMMLPAIALLACICLRDKGLVYLSVFLVPVLFIHLMEKFDFSAEHYVQVTFYAGLAIALISLVASFFVLRKIQQKS